MRKCFIGDPPYNKYKRSPGQPLTVIQIHIGKKTSH